MGYWPRPLVFLDTETGGLDSGAQAWEIAMTWRHPTRGQHTIVIHVTDFDRDAADPDALRIGRFEDRWLQSPEDEIRQMTEEDALHAVFRGTRGATLVGQNPSFDMRILEHRMARYGVEPRWHHRPKCVSNMVEALTRRECPGLHRAAEAMGLEYDEAVLHSALGDILLVERVWDAIMEVEER